MIEIIIPIEQYSKQLDETVASIEATVSSPNLKIIHEPDLNVAECRHKAIQESSADYLCFLDYDSVMIMDGWLDAMFSTMLQNPQAAGLCMEEWWGTERRGVTLHPRGPSPVYEVDFGPAACLMIDKSKIPDTVVWDKYIGLANGWLGGDAEEVAWQYELRQQTGYKIMRMRDWMFHHKGGKTTAQAFLRTDRAKTCSTMMNLIKYKYSKCPEDRDFFKQLHYLRADPCDDTMLLSGTLRDCYKDVIKANGLHTRNKYIERGLV